MPRTAIAVDGERHCVRLAATAAERAAGFQHVPAGRMDAEAILFLYAAPRRPSYHMRNVEKPLRLAWIAPDGRVSGVIAMQPETTGHDAEQPVIAVLEFTPAHPLAEQVRTGTRLTLDPQGAAASCR